MAACKCAEIKKSFLHTNFPQLASDSKRIRKNLRSNCSLAMLPLFRSRYKSVTTTRKYILSMDAREQSRSTILKSSKNRRVPVYVMMPLDMFGIDAFGSPRIRKIKAIIVSLRALKLVGVHGIAIEVWWGIVERASPFSYNWSLYEEIFQLISDMGLKLHVSLSFHSNKHASPGGKEGIGLPLWILEVGKFNKDIYYHDRNGFSNDDYLTLGVDHIPLFSGRTAVQCYEDLISSFVKKFEPYIGTVIKEISIGLGPSGELRYPAHPFGDGRWRFPGIGEFQCYDKYMLEDLKMAACLEGKPHWGENGPQNAGCYNSFPAGVPFFEEGQESFISDYGRFFLEWYSAKLISHADSILSRAANILKKYQENEQTSVVLAAKIGGVYWWYQTVSHAAELTAGYYNTALRDGYDPIASVFSRHGAALHIPCWEMVDTESMPIYGCSPEGFLQQIRTISKRRIIHLIGRNTNERYDEAGLQQIHANCYHPQAESVRSFTYFRLNANFFRGENWNKFVPFIKKMSSDLL